jgi:hypothetical protein
VTDDTERADSSVGPHCGACGVRLRIFVAPRRIEWRCTTPGCPHYDDDPLAYYVDAGAPTSSSRATATPSDPAPIESGAERPGGAGAGGDAAAGAGVRGATVRRYEYVESDDGEVARVYHDDDGEEVRQERYVNKQLHICGCVTVFDTDKWCSKLVSVCADHVGAVRRREEERVKSKKEAGAGVRGATVRLDYSNDDWRSGWCVVHDGKEVTG